jgi:hypothetical protein
VCRLARHRQWRAEEIGRHEGRYDDDCSQHFDVEGNAQQNHRHEEHAQACRFHRQAQCPGRREQAEHQGAVRVVGSVNGHTDRRDSEEQCRQQPGRCAETTPHQIVEQGDGRDAFDDLRHVDAHAAEAQHPGAGDLQPQGQRRFIDRYETGRIKRVEEEVVPALQHAQHARSVVLRAESGLIEMPDAQQRRQREHQCEPDAPNDVRAEAACAAEFVRITNRGRIHDQLLRSSAVTMHQRRADMRVDPQAPGIASAPD